jgi:hypothetical protein
MNTLNILTFAFLSKLFYKNYVELTLFSAVNISFYGIKQDGTLWAWGRNINGRLGTGNLDSTFETDVPQQIGTASNWKKVISAPLHAIALKTDGTIWSWGDSTGQFLGYVGGNLNNNFRSPKQVGTATDWDNIFASSYAKSFGIKTNGRLWSWGLGHPNAPLQLLPYAQLPIPFGVESWVMSSINGNLVFLLKTDGTRWGEGYNYWPQYLGTGPNTGGSSYSMVTQLDADTDWKYVHANQTIASGFAIKENGGLYFWGFGWFAGEGPFISPTLIANPCTLGTETFEEQAKVSIAPNPAGNFTTLTFGNPTDAESTYWITNSLGQIVQAETTISDQTKIVTIDTSSYSFGVYYLFIKMNNQTKTLRILKSI